MLRIKVFQNSQTSVVPSLISIAGSPQSVVAIAPLTTPLGPTEILVGGVGTGTPYKLADFSANTTNEGVFSAQNKAAFSIFWAFGSPGTPGLTTSNGIELPAGAFLTLDNIGGAVIWAASGTPQTAGSGTRVSAESRP